MSYYIFISTISYKNCIFNLDSFSIFMDAVNGDNLAVVQMQECLIDVLIIVFYYIFISLGN